MRLMAPWFCTIAFDNERKFAGALGDCHALARSSLLCQSVSLLGAQLEREYERLVPPVFPQKIPLEGPTGRNKPSCISLIIVIAFCAQFHSKLLRLSSADKYYATLA